MLGRIARFRLGFFRIATEFYALYLTLRDPRTSWGARIIAVIFAFYVIFPIDVLPEALPLVGILDDLLMIPAGYAVVSRLVPVNVLEAAHRRAEEENVAPRIWRASLIVVALLLLVWCVALVFMVMAIWRLFQ